MNTAPPADAAALLRAALAATRAQVTATCVRAGRDPASVRLLPVSKTAPAERLRWIHMLGVRELRDQLRQDAPDGIGMDELSMGMSGDFALAIAEGATTVRIGTAIFGRRHTPDRLYWPGFTSP